jgi:hypothetical protein
MELPSAEVEYANRATATAVSGDPQKLMIAALIARISGATMYAIRSMPNGSDTSAKTMEGHGC